MCTAITWRHYFGRTLDYDCDFGQEVTLTPRNFPIPLRSGEALERHYAILGMARVEEGFPLYFDAVNEKGLAMAGLNFVGNAVYRRPIPSRKNVAHFELIPWLLGQCATISQARQALQNVRVTSVPFSESLPPASLHWLLADGKDTLTLEATADGLHSFENNLGVLTNNPPFPMQLQHLRQFRGLSNGGVENRFAPGVRLEPDSRGMGAMGLPGDLSSQSRFVRAAFTLRNSVCQEQGEAEISQFFHILGAVDQTRGCCRVGEGYEVTQYTSCCDLSRGIYYYTTYENRSITAVDMGSCEPEGTSLTRFPLLRRERILYQSEDTGYKGKFCKN